MKRIFIALALIASLQFANAQVKSESAAKSAVEKAQADTENPKKATKVATWMKLGQTLVDAYNAPAGNGWIGASKSELQLVMGNMKPTGAETIELAGQVYTKETYPTVDYYFGANQALQVINVTKPYVENALGRALEAYKKAAELDVKGSKTKDLSEAIKTISSKYVENAYNQYTLGDYAAASTLFEAAADASLAAPYAQVDTNALYNAGFTAWMTEQFERAKGLFEKCIDYGYYAEDGEVFTKLSQCVEKLGDKAGQKEILEKGFALYPQSQSILIGLINYYVESGDDPDKLFTLLDGAKKNEPNNASLYYVEGNIHKQLGHIDEAIASYRKCAEIDPAYEYGYIGEGILMYEQAVAFQEKANDELDDNKYNEYMKQLETSLKGCIVPFEKAYEVSKQDNIKASIAEYLKNACFRFRDEDASYQEKYEKFAAIVAASE